MTSFDFNNKAKKDVHIITKLNEDITKYGTFSALNSFSTFLNIQPDKPVKILVFDSARVTQYPSFMSCHISLLPVPILHRFCHSGIYHGICTLRNAFQSVCYLYFHNIFHIIIFFASPFSCVRDHCWA